MPKTLLTTKYQFTARKFNENFGETSDIPIHDKSDEGDSNNEEEQDLL